MEYIGIGFAVLSVEFGAVCVIAGLFYLYDKISNKIR